jgi:hypothetical protein
VAVREKAFEVSVRPRREGGAEFWLSGNGRNGIMTISRPLDYEAAVAVATLARRAKSAEEAEAIIRSASVKPAEPAVVVFPARKADDRYREREGRATRRWDELRGAV